MNSFRKILFFFNRLEKKKLSFIFLCIVITNILEMGGIAAIMPFMAVVANPSLIETNTYLSQIYQVFSFSQPKYCMLFLGLLVFCLLVLGNAFSALTSWVMVRFCYGQGKKITCSLLEKYLSQPYAFFLHRASGELAKNALGGVDRVVVGIFISGLQSFAKCIMILFTFVLLIMVDPILALINLVILGGAYAFTYCILRKRLNQAGILSSAINGKRLQLVYEVIGAIKELKVLGREQSFLNKLAEYAKAFAKVETLSQLSPLMTRYIIEAIAFGGMILIALYLICVKEDITQFVPLLGLYALAGYRLVPAMQQVFAGLSALKYHSAALDTLYTEMQLPTNNLLTAVKPLRFFHHIKLKHIHYHYPYSDKKILNNISIDIPRQGTIGIAGTSGAGKTTLIDIILGLLQPTQGSLIVDDIEINQQTIKPWQSNIGYVPQNIFLLDASIASNIALGVQPDKIDMNAVIKAAQLANIHDFIQQELPKGYETAVGERGIRLSGGQRQRIGIARALYHDPELLVFDEATSALDNVTEKAIMEAIKNLGRSKTIIIVAHRLNTIKECDRIYLLNQGEIVGTGKYAELYLTNKTFQYLIQDHQKTA